MLPQRYSIEINGTLNHVYDLTYFGENLTQIPSPRKCSLGQEGDLLL